MSARPHNDPGCQCYPCLAWDALARSAPITRCGETHARRTEEPCIHGFTRFCPSFGIAPGAYP